MKSIITAAVFLIIAVIANGQCLHSESEFKSYFENNARTLDPVEGIWDANFTFKEYYQGNLVNSVENSKRYNIYIIRNGDGFTMCLIPEKTEMKSTLRKTAIDGVYLYDKVSNQHSYEVNSQYKSNAILTGQSLLEYGYKLNFEEKKKKDWDNLVYEGTQSGIQTPMSETDKIEYLNNEDYAYSFRLIKIYPNVSEKKEVAGSGTGFAISSDGLIATNYHVINGANDITVKGINGDFSKAYTAKIIATDRNNDLAIIQITNLYPLTGIGKIPYVFSSKFADVGNSVFVLGYPLRASMGDEIKLTNGIISSKSGYQGDITSYQLSVPVQPGNSGGPVFDSKGNLVGIINAKLAGAENASYAIKTSYLLSLIETMSSPPKLQTISSLSNKSLAEQVKAVKNFTYIVEVK